LCAKRHANPDLGRPLRDRLLPLGARSLRDAYRALTANSAPLATASNGSWLHRAARHERERFSTLAG
jgi:hypothetical protein